MNWASGEPQAGGECHLNEPSQVAREAYLRACALDVAVRKPGNVSLASAAHGMQAAQFVASAQASAAALFVPGASVGSRIEAAIEATWAAVGCNTNLGIVLLCAPVAAAIERLRQRDDDIGAPAARARPEAALQAALETVLSRLDRDDAGAAFRAIARARPAGLGNAPEQDVHGEAGVDLRAAMVLAAHRDRIAQQYAQGYAEVFALGRFDWPGDEVGDTPSPALMQAVQSCYLRWLASAPDSHIVRKHGEAAARQVMHEARPWRERAEAGRLLDTDPGWAAWDEALKARGLNPGTSADLTVVSLMISRWCAVM